jgi:predicted RNA binding protein YcfA (HicA-like mRNA interferase family)
MTRDELIRRLRRLARRRDVAFEVARERGKGGHWSVRFGDTWQPVPQSKGRDLKPGTLRSILHEFGLQPRDLE